MARWTYAWRNSAAPSFESSTRYVVSDANDRPYSTRDNASGPRGAARRLCWTRCLRWRRYSAPRPRHFQAFEANSTVERLTLLLQKTAAALRIHRIQHNLNDVQPHVRKLHSFVTAAKRSWVMLPDRAGHLTLPYSCCCCSLTGTGVERADRTKAPAGNSGSSFYSTRVCYSFGYSFGYSRANGALRERPKHHVRCCGGLGDCRRQLGRAVPRGHGAVQVSISSGLHCILSASHAFRPLPFASESRSMHL